MSRTSSLGQFTNLPVLADAADITSVGTTMADQIEEQVLLRFATTAARDAAVTSPIRGMECYIDADNFKYIYTGSAWTPCPGPSHGTLTTWTPTVTQGGAVTITVTNASYVRLGRALIGRVTLLVTGGAGAANNFISVSTPVTVVSGGEVVYPCGSGIVFDASANLYYPMVALTASTTSFRLLDTTIASNVYGGQTGSTFAAALVNTDKIAFDFFVEAAAD